MLLTACLLAVLSCTLASPVFEPGLVSGLQTRLEQGADPETLFRDFRTVFNKTYEDKEEELMRKKIFAVNVDYIKGHNLLFSKGKKSYTLAVNQFADLTHREFLMLYTGLGPLQMPRNGSTFLAPSNVQLPDSVDWRKKGYVTPVKSQGQCGSCWAFSTTGSLEGQAARKTGKLVSLSEQQLVDCSTENDGCDGGLVDEALAYIKSKGGIESEADYPYTGKAGPCKFSGAKVVPGTAVTGYMDVMRGSESALQEAVATVGPISIAIDASHPSIMHYSSGIYYEPLCSPKVLNHTVLAVGYGSSSGDHWLVKNSWGTTWGESGYIKMTRNRGNNCGVASDASYPLL